MERTASQCDRVLSLVPFASRTAGDDQQLGHRGAATDQIQVGEPQRFAGVRRKVAAAQPAVAKAASACPLAVNFHTAISLLPSGLSMVPTTAEPPSGVDTASLACQE